MNRFFGKSSWLAAAVILLAVALPGRAVVATPPASATVNTMTVGIHEPHTWRTNWPVQVTPDQTAWLISLTGATSHRMWVSWQQVEPTAPVKSVHKYNFAPYDAMYQADLAQGIRPLMVAIDSPPWAWRSDVPRQGQQWGIPPASNRLADWRSFCAAMAKRYPQAIGIEIWNEPNFTLFWGRGYPQVAPDPAYYTTLLSNAYKSIKAVAPQIKVIGGALANFDDGWNGNISASQFANGMYASGAATAMNAISTHPYPSDGSAAGMEQFHNGIYKMRSARQTVGANTPIWITEGGISTTGSTAVSEDEQATLLTEMVSWADAQPDIDAFYVHTLTEPTQDESTPDKGYALMHGETFDTLVAKPAFWALRSLLVPSG